MSTISFFEFYRAAMPMFVPSVKLLRSWVVEHGIMWERIYGTPKRQVADMDHRGSPYRRGKSVAGHPYDTHLSSAGLHVG